MHCGGLAFSDTAAGDVIDWRAEGRFGKQYRESAGLVRDAGCGRAAWSEGNYRAICDGQGERCGGTGEEVSGAVPRRPGELGLANQALGGYGSKAGAYGSRLF